MLSRTRVSAKLRTNPISEIHTPHPTPNFEKQQHLGFFSLSPTLKALIEVLLYVVRTSVQSVGVLYRSWTLHQHAISRLLSPDVFLLLAQFWAYWPQCSWSISAN